MERYKKLCIALLYIAIFFAVLHLSFLLINQQFVDIQSLLLNVIPYGLPILVCSLAVKDSRGNKPLWSNAGFVLAILFGVCYVSMVTHITLMYIIGCVVLKSVSYANLYFNVPIIYGIAMTVLFVFWLMKKSACKIHNNEQTDNKKTSGQLITGKVLFWLPVALTAIMIVNCSILLAIGFSRESGEILSTSFPTWATALITCIIYLPAISICTFVSYLYHHYISHKKSEINK